LDLLLLLFWLRANAAVTRAARPGLLGDVDRFLIMGSNRPGIDVQCTDNTWVFYLSMKAVEDVVIGRIIFVGTWIFLV